MGQRHTCHCRHWHASQLRQQGTLLGKWDTHSLQRLLKLKKDINTVISINLKEN